MLYWQPEDNRPDKEGEYRNVAGLKVDVEQVGGAHIFRPWGWKVVLLVSEHVKSEAPAHFPHRPPLPHGRGGEAREAGSGGPPSR